MTATTDMAGHPDVTEISDLAEGLLSPSRTASLRQHLDECSSCAELLESLEEIRELLGAVSAPSAMPEDVVARIDVALAAEAQTQARDEEPAEKGPGDDRAHVSRETSLAPSMPASRPSRRPRARTGPGRKGRPSADHGARARRRVTALATVCTVAALGVGVLLVQSRTGGGSQDQTAQASASDTFSGKRLKTQVDALLDPAQKDPGAPSLESGPDTRGSTGYNPRMQASALVPECIRAAIGSDSDALAAKEGTYLGKKAYLVVLPDASDDAHVMAYVVDGTCLRQPSMGPGQVLVKHSYARP